METRPHPISILMIEDDPRSCVALDAVLTDVSGAGFSTDCAHSLSDGLSKLGKNSFDLVMLDLDLPDSGGLDTLQRVLEAHGEVPVVVLTGTEDEGLALEAMHCGAQDYLVKGEARNQVIHRAIRYALERHRLVVALEESGRGEIESREKGFEGILMHMADGIVIVDQEGIVLFANPAAVEMFGDGKLVGERFGFPMVAGESTELDVASAGTSRVVDLRSTQTVWKGNAAILASMRDITERKDMEERLRIRTGELHLRSAAIEAAANAILVTDRDGIILYTNPAFEQLTGYSPDECWGLNPKFMKSGQQDQVFYRKLWETITAGEVWRGELSNKKKDGTIYIEEMTITPLKDADGTVTHFIAIKQDVSQRRASEAEIRSTNEQLAAALRKLKQAQSKLVQEERLHALGTMASGIAHDLNNVLTPILGFSELLLYSPGLLDDRERTKEFLETMNTAAQDASGIVGRLREFYREREDDDILKP
ncbi:MAG: PAS domain S-box protein, partial [Planctomycetota bacterium]|nr:PAS domain S-box protein [Planctomycetota bacterium]